MQHFVMYIFASARCLDQPKNRQIIPNLSVRKCA